MKNMMMWSVGGVGTLALFAFLVSLGYGWYVRHVDRRYHAGVPKIIKLESETFENDGTIPMEFSCEQNGGGSPHLKWAEASEGTKSFALIVIDPDIPSSTIHIAEFTHWALYNIPAGVMELPSKVSSADLNKLGMSIGRNGAGQKQFYPPCPLSGTHDYLFRLYALDVEALQLRRENKKGILAAMEGHVLAYGELTGKYQNQKLDFKAAMGWNMTRMTQTR